MSRNVNYRKDKLYLQQEFEAIVSEIITKYEAEIVAAVTEEQMNKLMEKIKEEIFLSIAEVVKDAFESAEHVSKRDSL